MHTIYGEIIKASVSKKSKRGNKECEECGGVIPSGMTYLSVVFKEDKGLSHVAVCSSCVEHSHMAKEVMEFCL